MRLAKIVFWMAGGWGVLVLTRLYLMFDTTVRQDPHTHSRLTSPLHPSPHVDSVGCDQLCIRHLCTELELLEPSLSFWLGEKRQQVLASQPVA